MRYIITYIAKFGFLFLLVGARVLQRKIHDTFNYFENNYIIICIIRADQLVKYIKDMYEKSKESASSDEKMFEWAKSYLDLHKEADKDYTAKYEQYKTNNSKAEGV